MSEEEEKFSKIDFLMLRDQDDQYILDNMELLKDKIQRSFNQEELNNLLLTTIKDHPFSQYVIDLLIDSGADVDHQDKDGDTAVHLAVSFNGLKVDLEALDRRREILLEALLDHGADVEIKNYFGQTACDIAKENKDLYPNIYKTFLKHSIKMGLATGRPKIDHIDPELYSFATNCESEIRALARIRIKGHFTLCHILYSLKARNSFNRILWEKLDVIFEHFYLEISQCFPLYASCLRSSYRKVRRSRSSLLNVAVDSCSSSRRILPVQMLPIELRFKILKCLSAKDLENFINRLEFQDRSLHLYQLLNSLHAARMSAAVAKAHSDDTSYVARMSATISKEDASYTQMNAAVSKAHSDDASFACSCGKAYVHYNSLWRHKKYECGRTPQFHCNICSARYMQKNALEIHFRVKHGIGR